jgi:acyl-CoA dehydrogenase
MSLVLTEEQEQLSSTAREFVAGKSSLKRIRQLRDAADADGFSRDLWREMAALGWLGIIIPEEHGGVGLGYVDLMGVMEACGRGLMPEPMTSTVLLGGNALLLGGTDAQQGEYLPGVAAGERLLSVAYQEPQSRYRLDHVETHAAKSGGGWVLTGQKIQVLDAHVADALVVSARTSGAVGDAVGVTLFLVPSDTPGLTIERQHRLDARNAGLVHLGGIKLGADAVVGQVDQGGALLARVVDRATIGLTAEMLGGMQATLEMTLDYLKTRTQFGVLIGTFQALKHRAAQMFVELELARSAVMDAHRIIDDGGDDTAIAHAASLAKARCSDTYIHVVHEAVQMLGGIGMTDEHDVGFYVKRARVAEMTFGDGAWHRERVARLEGY